MRSWGRLVALLFAATACGDGPAAPPADATAGIWITLVSEDWSLPPGGEDWRCAQVTLASNLDIVGIRPIAPPGTHHTLLGVGQSGTPGVCTGAVQSFVYASGVGTNELTMPDGVGLRFHAGQSLELELHLFNTGEEPLSGTSGIEVFTALPGEIVNEAEIFLPGPLVLDIPPGTVTQSGTCTIDQAQTVFAIFPHMHQLGSHFRSIATVGGTPVTLVDAPYSFDEQLFSPILPVTLAPGDAITSECTYENTTGEQVVWGNSSTQEMCFSILYRYPKIPGAVFCVQ